MSVPRPEYPRPQLLRREWSCLNGVWELAYDERDVGLRDGWEGGRTFDRRVVVPFPLESERSGVADPSPPPVVWVRRRFEVPEAWRGGRVALRIGACDQEARVFVNGRDVGGGRGGQAPVACEVGHALRAGGNEVVVRIHDPATWTRPRGKQAAGALRTPVDYDPVTGIWQSVWLEPLPPVSIDAVWTRFRHEDGALAVHVALSEPFEGTLEVVLRDGERELARARRETMGRPESRVPLQAPRARRWSPEDPHLHALEVVLLEGERLLDRVTSQVGLRE
ncbi:MAG: hypothetical protein R3263_09265, partial [Myxococcota bacterium]|nr:hypothetical protein [Myxococcota bacterium]